MLTVIENIGSKDVERSWMLLQDGKPVAELAEVVRSYRQPVPPFGALALWFPGEDRPAGTLAFEMERFSWKLWTESYFQQNGCLLTLLKDYLKFRKEVPA